MLNWRFGTVGLFLSAGILLAGGCSEKKESHRAASSVPVTVATATETTVPVQISAIGRVEPFATVAVKAMVSGVVHHRPAFLPGPS